MLCVNNYPQKYIDDCRASFAEQVSAYQALVATARNLAAGDDGNSTRPWKRLSLVSSTT